MKDKMKTERTLFLKLTLRIWQYMNNMYGMYHIIVWGVIGGSLVLWP